MCVDIHNIFVFFPCCYDLAVIQLLLGVCWVVYFRGAYLNIVTNLPFLKRV